MWNPEEYLKFGDERTRPAIDLVARIGLAAPKRIVDLGCGPGNSTSVLRRRWPEAAIVGLDSSPEMISRARESWPEGHWVIGDIANWDDPGTFDLVFSNAALQWVPGHLEIAARYFSRQLSGAQLAVQAPSGDYAGVRGMMREISEAPEWRGRLSAARGAITLESPSSWYETLSPLARAVDIWETIYYHVMESPEAIVTWISSTGLRPFLDALDSAPERELFVSRLSEAVAAGYERRSDGRVLFPFRRTFIIATR